MQADTRNEGGKMGHGKFASRGAPPQLLRKTMQAVVTPLLFFSYRVERAITRLRSCLEDLRPQTSWRFGHAITTELTAPSHRLQQRGSGNWVE